MKTKNIILSVLLVSFFIPVVFAQQDKNQLFYVLKHQVKSEKMEEYRASLELMVAACQEHNYSFAFSTWESELPDFYIFYPVKDYNTITDIRGEWAKLVPNMKSGFMERFIRSIESWEEFYLKADDDISYKPESTVDGLVYVEWWIRYINLGERGKYRGVFRRASEMHEKSNFAYPILRCHADIGMNSPAIITVFWGKNLIDLYTHIEKGWDNFGEEVQGMINSLDQTTRKFEKIPFWYQEELSYTPE